MSARSWVFTLNNYTKEDERALVEDWPPTTRLVVGREIGEECATPHLQGAVTFRKPMRFSGVKKLFPKAHWERMNDRGSKAWDYCRKGNDMVVDKDDRQQGKRNDLELVKQRIMEGATDEQLWDEFYPLMVRYGKAITSSREKLFPMKVVSDFKLSDFKWEKMELDKPTIIWGEPGIGKTQFALAHFKNPLMVSHMDDLTKLTSAHDGIVFDDMAFTHIPRTGQIHLVDQDFTRSIHVRYTTAQIPKGMKRVFTTNVEGGRIMDIDDGAIDRRINVLHLNKFI